MKQELEFKNFDPTGEVRKLIENRIPHLGLQGARVPPGAPSFCAARLHDVGAVIRSPFRSEQQLEAYKSGRRGEFWRV